MGYFQKGDRVVITKAGATDDYKVGDIVIIDESASDFPYAHRESDGYAYPITANDAELIKEDKMETKFKVGDCVINEDGQKRKIIQIEYKYQTQDIFDGTDDTYWWGEDEVKDWTLAPDVLEVTLEQIAKKFNVSVDKLKIKK